MTKCQKCKSNLYQCQCVNPKCSNFSADAALDWVEDELMNLNVGYYRFLKSVSIPTDREVHVAAFIYRDRATAFCIYHRVKRMHKRLYGCCLYRLIDGNCIYQLVPYCRITRAYYSAVATCELEDVAVGIGVKPFKDWWAVGASCSLPRRLDWYPNDVTP